MSSKPSTSSSMQSGLCADNIQAGEKIIDDLPINLDEENKDGSYDNKIETNEDDDDEGYQYERNVTPAFQKLKSSFNVGNNGGGEIGDLRDSSMKFADDCN